MALEKKLIGQTELIDFPELHLGGVIARVDTGAQTSAIWASDICLREGALHFTLFDDSSKYHTGDVVRTRSYRISKIVSSNGNKEERYVVKLLILIAGRKIRASFSLANRSTQKYPVLVGRNILSGKFLVDVQHGHDVLAVQQNSKKVVKDLII
jgi:hypothetical protein